MKHRSRLTKKDAEKILELSGLYTDEDRKNAYQRLAKKYHPNFNPGDSSEEHTPDEEKFKEVNEANEVLIGKIEPALEQSSFNWSGFTDSIIKQREELVRKLKQRDDISFKDCASYLTIIGKEFTSIISHYEQSIYFGKRPSQELYDEANQKLNDKLKELEKEFLSKNGINKEEIGEMDYTLSIGTFFKELIQRIVNTKFSVGALAPLKEKLINESKKYFNIKLENIKQLLNDCINKLIIDAVTKGFVGNEYEEKVISIFNNRIKSILSEAIKKELEKEKANFSSYGYDFLTTKMDNIIKSILQDFQVNNNLGDFLQNFKAEVDKLIKDYHQTLDSLNDLESIIDTIKKLVGETEKTDAYKDKIFKLKERLKQGKNIDNDFNILNGEIRKYFIVVQRNIDLAKNPLVQSEYAEFEKKYHEKLASLNPIRDIKVFSKMNELMTATINLFQSLVLGIIDISEFLTYIGTIDFDNIDEAIKKLEEYSLGKSNVYINVNTVPQLQERGKGFFLLKEEDSELYMYYISYYYGPKSLRHFKISAEQLKRRFESIESILSRSDYLGCLTRESQIYNCYILYSNPELRIVRNIDNDRIFTKSQDLKTHNSYKKRPMDENAGYGDKKELIARIKKDLEETYNSEKQKNAQSSYYAPRRLRDNK